jgi:predicted alpha/beta-hydrolase family hydrolase
MPKAPETLKVNVTESDSVTALLYPASSPRLNATLILGHGAGANQLSPFMKLFADGLSERGLDAITFNFLYMERGRGAPDPKAKLESCYQSVIDAALSHKKLKSNRLAIGGKSMGGRIASQVAAADGKNVDALVFLGYPLHPPGKPEQLRDAHLKDIRAPMLFIQGSKDPFGTSDEIRSVIKKHKLSATLYVIEGGDHSFKVPKSTGLSQSEVYESITDKIIEWLKANTK